MAEMSCPCRLKSWINSMSASLTIMLPPGRCCTQRNWVPAPELPHIALVQVGGLAPAVTAAGGADHFRATAAGLLRCRGLLAVEDTRCATFSTCKSIQDGTPIHNFTTLFADLATLAPDKAMVSTGPDQALRCWGDRWGHRAGPLTRWKATPPVSCRYEPETLHLGPRPSSIIVFAASGSERN